MASLVASGWRGTSWTATSGVTMATQREPSMIMIMIMVGIRAPCESLIQWAHDESAWAADQPPSRRRCLWSMLAATTMLSSPTLPLIKPTESIDCTTQTVADPIWSSATSGTVFISEFRPAAAGAGEGPVGRGALPVGDELASGGRRIVQELIRADNSPPITRSTRRGAGRFMCCVSMFQVERATIS